MMTTETIALFPDLEPVNRAYYATARAQLTDQDRTDRAAYIRAKASGIRWYCPGACTAARGDDCACPCGHACHGQIYCHGH